MFVFDHVHMVSLSILIVTHDRSRKIVILSCFIAPCVLLLLFFSYLQVVIMIMPYAFSLVTVSHGRSRISFSASACETRLGNPHRPPAVPGEHRMSTEWELLRELPHLRSAVLLLGLCASPRANHALRTVRPPPTRELMTPPSGHFAAPCTVVRVVLAASPKWRDKWRPCQRPSDWLPARRHPRTWPPGRMR